MPATPFWFGKHDRPLFGWLHLPENGYVRGGVILCPPLGIEAICVYYSYRLLAEQLAATGTAVLRFDYDGTGDSFGNQDDPDRVALWQASVTSAVDVLREAGVGAVALAGVRMGALLAAAEAERRGGVEGLVLWDPCLSGAAFLRDQKIFQMLSLDTRAKVDGSIEAPGVLFPAETVKSLSELNLLAMQGPLARNVLVLEDPDRPHSRRLESFLTNSDAEWGIAEGQAALLDPPRQETPHATISQLATWLTKLFADRDAVAATAPDRPQAVLGLDVFGQDIVERAVSLGPDRLFGIVTAAEGHDRSPVVVFVDEGNTPHIGQSRMWVDLGRDLARHGLRTLRFDLSGNGDSAPRPGRPGHVAWAAEAFDDVTDAMSAISPTDPSDVVLVGLCSGAYQALEAGLTRRPRGISLINPVSSFELPESEADDRRIARQSTKTWFVRLMRPFAARVARHRGVPDPGRWIVSLENAYWPAAVARRFDWIPEPAWWAINHAFVDTPIAGVLERLVDSGVDLQLVVGPEDLLPIKLGAQRTFIRLQRSGRFWLDLLPGLDHSALIVDQRAQVMNAISSRLIARYAPKGDSPSGVV